MISEIELEIKIKCLFLPSLDFTKILHVCIQLDTELLSSSRA